MFRIHTISGKKNIPGNFLTERRILTDRLAERQFFSSHKKSETNVI